MSLCLTVDSAAGLVCSSLYLKQKKKKKSQVNEPSPVTADNLQTVDLQTVNKPADAAGPGPSSDRETPASLVSVGLGGDVFNLLSPLTPKNTLTWITEKLRRPLPVGLSDDLGPGLTFAVLCALAVCFSTRRSSSTSSSLHLLILQREFTTKLNFLTPHILEADRDHRPGPAAGLTCHL